MDKFVHSNFAVTTLLQDIGVDDVVLTVNVDDLARFPTLIGGSKFPLVLADSDEIVEIVYVTLVSVGGTLTVERGREGTVAQSWLAGTLCRHTFTASSVMGAAGLRPLGVWNAATQYEPGSVVEHAGVSYISVNTSINSAPSVSSSDWQTIYSPSGGGGTAMNWLGRWNSGTTYAIGQVVEHVGRIWQSNAAIANSAPAVGNNNWTHIAKWSGYAAHEAVLAFTGTNNYSTTIVGNEAPTTLYDGLKIVGRFANTNTTGITLALNALPATPARYKFGVDFGPGDIIPSELYEFIYVVATNEFVAKQAPGVNKDIADLLIMINTVASVPTGVILPYGGASAPLGWLQCDGTEFSRTGPTAALFAVIGTTFGPGNGSTTANLPDMRGRVPAMAPGGSGRIAITGLLGGFSSISMGAAGGLYQHQLTWLEMPIHNHGVNDPGHFHAVVDPQHSHLYNSPTSTYNVNAGVQQAVWTASVSGGASGSAPTGISISPNSTGISVQNSGSGEFHNMMQPTLLVNYIIKI